MNANLAAFLSFQTLYLDQQEALQDDDDEIAIAAVKQVRSEMVSKDETALKDPENWWAVILEQIEESSL